MRVFAIVALAAVVLFLGLYSLNSDPVRDLVFESDDVVFAYSSRMQSIELTDTDTADGFIARLRSKDNDSSQSLVSIRKEDGFEALAKQANLRPVDIVLNNIDRTYPSRFPGYKVITQTEFDYQGSPAAEIVFSYGGADEIVLMQRLDIRSASSDTMIYIASQATSEEFDLLNSSQFDTIIETLKVN